MPAYGNISFGVCPEGACDRSYRKGQSLRSGLVHWRNAASIPSSIKALSLDQRIVESCQAVLQPRQHARGTCASCGHPLVFASHLPELGECQLCRRPYREEDLERPACPECEAPVEFEEALKSRLAMHAAISEILHVVPHLRHYGYLDTLGRDVG